MRRAILIALLVLGLAAVAQASTSRRSLFYTVPEDVTERFDFEVTHAVTTELRVLPEEAERYDLTPVRRRLGHWTDTTAGLLERQVARVLRDRSLGVLVTARQLRGSVDRGEGPEPADISALEGKSVALRMLPSGELLDTHGWDHISGAARGGERLLEVLAALSFRLPVSLPRGTDPVGGTFRTRMRVDPHLERRQDWVVSYRLTEAPPDCPKPCLAVAYEADIHEDSQDKHPARPMELDGTGEAHGTILLHARSHRLVGHDFSLSWQRELTTRREDGAVRGTIGQTVQVDGRVRLLP